MIDMYPGEVTGHVMTVKEMRSLVTYKIKISRKIRWFHICLGSERVNTIFIKSMN